MNRNLLLTLSLIVLLLAACRPAETSEVSTPTLALSESGEAAEVEAPTATATATPIPTETPTLTPTPTPLPAWEAALRLAAGEEAEMVEVAAVEAAPRTGMSEREALNEALAGTGVVFEEAADDAGEPVLEFMDQWWRVAPGEPLALEAGERLWQADLGGGVKLWAREDGTPVIVDWLGRAWEVKEAGEETVVKDEVLGEMVALAEGG